MREMNDNIHPEDEKKNGLYPRIITMRTVFLDELIKSASHRTTLSPQEMRMAYELILQQMIDELKIGNNVCFDDFGMFSLSATARRVQDEKEIRSYSIEVKRLVFRMSIAFLKKLGVVHFERVPPKFYKNKKRLKKGKPQ
jgi:predicted histone-like DNA-binding protein